MSELELHYAVAKMLDLLGWQWCHCPNGGKRNPREAAKLRGMGVKPGVPDVLVFERWEGCGDEGHGVAIELKGPKGRISKLQQQWLERLDERGWLVGVCSTTDEIVELLQYVVPRNGCSVINGGVS